MSSQPRGRDRGAVERAVAELIRGLGLDPSRDPELAQTPSRVADLYLEVFSGLEPDSEPDLVTFPHSGSDDLVAVRDLPFHSLCVHHFIPFFGRAHLVYVPGERIIGVSGVARLVDHYARRPQLQERMTAQIADHVEKLLRPRGVAVLLEARHLCMEMRGVRRFGRVETRVVRGALRDTPWTGLWSGGRRKAGR